uniref:Uncharacterized protein n=1 Tax=Gibberella zeae TaxID=5518 RepID=A0A4E9EHN8_GIBZA
MGVSRPDSIQASDVDADTREIFSMRPSSLEDLAPSDPETLEFNSSHFSLSLDEENLILGLDIPAVKSEHHGEADANLQSLTSKDTLHGTRKRSNNEESQQAADSKRRRLDSTYSGENGVKMPFNSNYRSGQNGRAGRVVSLSPSPRDVDRRRCERRENLRAGDATVVISEIRRVGPLSLMNDGNKLSSKKCTELARFEKDLRGF